VVGVLVEVVMNVVVVGMEEGVVEWDVEDLVNYNMVNCEGNYVVDKNLNEESIHGGEDHDGLVSLTVYHNLAVVVVVVVAVVVVVVQVVKVVLED
jgi:hypothetical protein